MYCSMLSIILGLTLIPNVLNVPYMLSRAVSVEVLSSSSFANALYNASQVICSPGISVVVFFFSFASGSFIIHALSISLGESDSVV